MNEQKKPASIKFHKHAIVIGTLRCRVSYMMPANPEEGPLTIHQRDYGYDLFKAFPEHCRNDTDSSSDYFDKTTAKVPKSHPLYAAVLKRCQMNHEARNMPKGQKDYGLEVTKLEDKPDCPNYTSWEIKARGVKYTLSYDHANKSGFPWIISISNNHRRIPSYKCGNTLKSIEQAYKTLQGLSEKITVPEQAPALRNAS